MKKISALVRLGLFGMLVILLAIAASFFAPHLMSYVLSSRDQIANFVKHHHLLSVLFFFIVYVIDNVLMLPIASLLTVMAGMFYGPVEAILVTLCAATIGALVSFFLARYLVGRWLQRVYAAELRRFNELFSLYGTYYLFIVRLIPIIPFVLVNVFAGVTLVRTRVFILTTFFGLLPVTILLVFSGRELQHAVTLSDIFSGRMIFLGIILILMTFLPLLVKKTRIMV